MSEQIAGRVAEAFSEFMVPLRQGDALSQPAYESVVAMLRRVAEELSDSRTISKDLCRLLVELYPQLLGIAAGRSDNDRKQIERWAEDLLDEISAVLD